MLYRGAVEREIQAAHRKLKRQDAVKDTVKDATPQAQVSLKIWRMVYVV